MCTSVTRTPSLAGSPVWGIRKHRAGAGHREDRRRGYSIEDLQQQKRQKQRLQWSSRPSDRSGTGLIYAPDVVIQAGHAQEG